MEGHLFEIKALTLFLIRGSIKDYEFQLANNMEGLGGKLDDLIFKYKVGGENAWRYRYLQAKHKKDERDMKGSQLTAETGDFGLAKYFRSYCRIVARGDDIHDCIIFTNIGFDVPDLKTAGIELDVIKTSDDILDFSNINLKNKLPTRHKLKIAQTPFRQQMLDNSDDKILAENLHRLVAGNEKKAFQHEIFKAYHVSLVEEKVIDVAEKKFCSDFVDGTNLTAGAQQLRDNLALRGNNWKTWKFKLPNNFGTLTAETVKNPLPIAATNADIEGFLDKLVFAVNSPNETEMDKALLSDLEKFYSKYDCEQLKDNIIKYTTAWFKERNPLWLSTTNGKEQLLSGVNSESDAYQKQLEVNVGFSAAAISDMTKKLEPLMNLSSDDHKAVRMTTPSPRYTAVKVIAALKLQPKCRYLVTSSSCLQNKDEKQRWKNILQLEKDSDHFLVVVCQDGDPIIQQDELANLLPKLSRKNNKVIFIGGEQGEMVDDINYNDFDTNLQETILSRTISFQGKEQTVRDLIPYGMQPGDVIDWLSIKELVIDGGNVNIPAFDTSRFHRSLYIKRQIIQVSFDNHFHDELARSLECSIQNLEKECKVDPKGKIQWQAITYEYDRKKKIMEKMKMILERNNSIKKSANSKQDDEFLHEENWGRRAFIISGVAGTGKSTVLSHYYTTIKEANPDWWIIKINLADYSKHFEKFDSFDRSRAFDFLASLPAVVGQSSFARSLLRNRLKMGDRIVLMLDGFDEIDRHCQEAAIQFMKAVTKTKNSSVRLYVTTRPHAADDLQVGLSQLAFTLDNFNTEDQVNYLTLFWQMAIKDKEETVLRKCAGDLIQQVTKTLKDKEKDFIGIPLQCWILAECYKQKVQNSNQNEIEENQFDLASLYELLMTKKEQVFLSEKLKLQLFSHHSDEGDLASLVVQETLKNIQFHMRKLAMETIFPKREDLDILLPSTSLVYQSDEDRNKEKDRLDKLSISYGLTDKNGQGKLEFLHRTFAEYLVAEYIYQGFSLEDDRHNKLLEAESTRYFIMKKIMIDKYDGVRVFLDSMLKKLVESQKWRDIVKRRPNVNPLPYRLQQIVDIKNLLYESNVTLISPIDYDIDDYWHCGDSDNSDELLDLHVSAVYVVAQGQPNIFHFLIDCLDATFTRTTVRKFITYLLKYLTPSRARSCSSALQRCFTYYEDADENELTIVWTYLKRAFHSLRIFANRGGTKEKVAIFIRFVEHHRKIFEKDFRLKDPTPFFFSPISDMWLNLVDFYIVSEFYDNDFEKFLQLLSGMYEKDESELIKFLKDAIINLSTEKELRGEFWNNARLKRLLSFVQKLGPRNEEMRYSRVMIKVLQEKEIAQLILKRDPFLFKEFYMIERAQTTETSKDIVKLLKRDCYGMTRLHRAVINDQVEVVDKILLVFRQHLNDKRHRNRIIDCLGYGNNNELMDILLEKKVLDISPLYLATICAHKDVLHKLIRFLKTNQLLKENFYISPLQEAKQFPDNCKIKILGGVLKSFKEILGYRLLPNLIDILILSWEWNEELFASFVKMVVHYDERNGYTHFGDLFTQHIIYCERILQFANDETLQKILSTITEAKFNAWIQLCFDTNFHSHGLVYGISLLILRYHDRFNKYQQHHILRVITSPTTTKNVNDDDEVKGTTYWAQWFLDDNNFDDKNSTMCKELCEWTSSFSSSEIDLKKILLDEDESNTSVISRAFLYQRKEEYVQIALSYLTKEDRNELHDHLIKQTPQLLKEKYFFSIDDYFMKCNIPMLFFYLNHASSEQLKTLVQEILFIREIFVGGTQCIFCDVIRCMTNEDITLFMKIVLEKLGNDAVSDLVLHVHAKRIWYLEFEEKGDIALVHDWFENEIECSRLFFHLQPNDQNELCHKFLKAVSGSNKFMNILSVEGELIRWVSRKYLDIHSPETRPSTNLLDRINVLFTYFIEKFNKDQLNQLIELITSRSVGPTINGVRQSIWTDYLVKASEETDDPGNDGFRYVSTWGAIQTFLRCVSEKLSEDFNWKEKLILHLHLLEDIRNDTADINRVASSTGKNFRIFQTLFAQLDLWGHESVHLFTFSRLSVFERIWDLMGEKRVEYLLRHFLIIDSQGKATNLPFGFDSSIHFLERFNKDEVKAFVESILSLKRFEDGKTQLNYSIWDEYINQAFATRTTPLYLEDLDLGRIRQTVHNFLKLVNEKMSSETVRKLLHHSIGSGPVISKIKPVDNPNDSWIIDAYRQLIKWKTFDLAT